MKIEQQILFESKEKKGKVDSTQKTYKKDSSYNVFDIQLINGNDKIRMQDDGIAILRILGNRFSKNAFLKDLEPTQQTFLLIDVLMSEIKIKKGFLPQELSVKNLLFSLFVQKK